MQDAQGSGEDMVTPLVATKRSLHKASFADMVEATVHGSFSTSVAAEMNSTAKSLNWTTLT